MRTEYTDLDIHFSFDNIAIQALNIIFERFTRTIPSHSHGNGCYEIHYIPYGYGKLKCEGVYYDITPDTLYVTGPHVEHAQTPLLHDPMQEYCVYLKISKNARAGSHSPVINAFTSTDFWIGQDAHGMHDLIRQLFSELENRYTGYENQIELLLSQMIICIVRNYEQCKNSVQSHIRGQMVDNKSMIIEEYFLYEYSSLSLDDLAKRLNLSARQTQRLLREYYNKSFQEKKLEARMSAAAILIGDKNRSIASIADALGYSTPEHFSSAFRSYYKTSPREFRKQLFLQSQRLF